MAEHLTEQHRTRHFEHPALAQVGWLGHADSKVYSLSENPAETEPGGFSPLYIQIGTYIWDAEAETYVLED